MSDTTQTNVQAIKMEPGSDMHLTVLMAPDHLNLVVGEDREALLRYAKRVWQAATKRATAVERERCASAIKRESDKTVSMAVLCGVEAVDLRPYEICEAAIVKGGAT